MRPLLLLILFVTFYLNEANPLSELEDDDEILKELEQLLHGNTPKNPSSGDEEAVSSNEDPSSSSDGAGCICKKYYECNISGDDSGGGNQVGPGPVPVPDPLNPDNVPEMELDIRFGPASQCGHYTEICCDNVRDNSSTTDLQNPDYKHTVCGKRNSDGVGFRAKGAVNQEAQFGEFPWMAAIVSPERNEGGQLVNVFVCGGSLIHPRVILTAAHCAYQKKPGDLIVRLGEWDTQTSNEIYAHKDYSVVEVIVHEKFYAGALYNDIALLILNEDAKVAPHIDTICLPPGSSVNFEGLRCYASGWGRDSFGKEGKYQVILKKLDLPVVPRDNCEYGLRRTRLGPYFKLHESFVCAGGEKGKDTCKGDGGSPLVCKLPGSDAYVQFGIVAWGIGCGDEGIPGVYVNIPMFVPWITNKMTEARLDTTYFKVGRSLK